MRVLPWPSRAERRAAVEAAAEAYAQTVAQRPELEEIVDRLHRLQEGNHFREAFESALRGGA